MNANLKDSVEIKSATNGGFSALSRIRQTGHIVWRRVFRAKRNHNISVYPPHFVPFLVILGAFILLAAHFDGDIAQQMAGPRNSFLEFLRNVTDAAKSHYYLIPALLIMTIVSVQNWQTYSLSGKKLLVRAYERAAFAFISIAVPGIFINIVKQLVGRGRPYTYDEFGPFVFSPFEFMHQFQSFPSGHATTAGSLGMIIALYYPAIRWPALIIAGLLAFARVPAQAHYLSDVMTGYLIGTMATLFFARWLASRATMFNLGSQVTFPELKK